VELEASGTRRLSVGDAASVTQPPPAAAPSSPTQPCLATTHSSPLSSRSPSDHQVHQVRRFPCLTHPTAASVVGWIWALIMASVHLGRKLNRRRGLVGMPASFLATTTLADPVGLSEWFSSLLFATVAISAYVLTSSPRFVHGSPRRLLIVPTGSVLINLENWNLFS
jgi:hypothetical protein